MHPCLSPFWTSKLPVVEETTHAFPHGMTSQFLAALVAHHSSPGLYSAPLGRVIGFLQVNIIFKVLLRSRAFSMSCLSTKIISMHPQPSLKPLLFQSFLHYSCHYLSYHIQLTNSMPVVTVSNISFFWDWMTTASFQSSTTHPYSHICSIIFIILSSSSQPPQWISSGIVPHKLVATH